MSSHLDQILDHTRLVVAERKQAANLAELERAAAKHTPRGFAKALLLASTDGVAVIAELKKASPSKGMIRPDFDAAPLATTLAAAGATCLSVLTDEKFFLGSLDNLRAASAACNIPCLRKDFMVDTFQVLEARANHADAILLIAAALTDGELRTLRNAARSMHLDVLCEVHNEDELHRVLDLDCEAFGVNSRDLKTFDVSLDVAERMVARLPGNAVRVAESGIHTPADIERLKAVGYNAFLVGESLMRQPDPAVPLRALLSPVVAAN